MNWEERNALVKEAYAQARTVQAGGYVRVNCPFCLDVVGKEDKRQCLSIHGTKGWYKCFRCDTRGKLQGFEEEGEEEAVENVAPEFELPPDFYELGIEPGLSAQSFEGERAYLRSRGLTDVSVWAAARLGACLKGLMMGRIVVPIHSPEGALWGWVSRSVYESDRTYLNCPGMSFGSKGRLYNQAATEVISDTPVLVVEGVFDSLALWPNAVAVLGKPTEQQLETLALAKRPVVVVLDGDAHREGWAAAMRLRLDGQRAGAVRLPAGLDPDEVDKPWLLARAIESLNE